ncbi:phage regulatory CII family protein [Xanthomonas campestris]|uniref:phage regulatory CII family protein n=1 Tax=Xanthomonas campestris TaxID=339 RepID=UPI003CF3E049
MNISDAAYHTVHAYPGGSEALATRLINKTEDGRERAMSAAVLRNKVNANNTTHHLTLAEASQIMGVTGDDRMLHALAAEHGYTLQRTEAPTGGNMLAALLSASSAKGKLAQIIGEAIGDGRITPNEATDIAAACGDAQAMLAEVAQHARAAAQAGAQ